MDELKLGMIGLDTSHCPAFAKLLSDKTEKYHVPGGRVVAAYPGGSSKMAVSCKRVEKFTAQMRDEFGVRIVDTIEELAGLVDGVMIESCDGRQHLEQFRKVAPFGKPVWIDKPLATTVKEAKAIAELAEKHNSPVFSCSSLRYARGIAETGEGKRVLGCVAYGPASVLDDFPGLFWYGIHAAEVLFAKMGRGCRQVVVRKTDTADVVTGVWADGRVGALYGYRIPKAGEFGCVLFTDGGAVVGKEEEEPPAYARLAEKYMEFFRTRKPPVELPETVEIVAFLEASNESRETGQAVALKV